ncbi:hypothetical protein CAPTEDRAFT_223509 [Capitella teleta]|uniref:Transthyretin/hydroxyisourate hydrolase domain-containing protein n=1 Tax=Capitella teleta TaxID=283909 RepID=R7UDC6_CAPTE|nr:hypothetical protein CAPTEDRAFT_223509 [Capitella teleta]|eukprot:ELU04385.1 hypothetical protein CAPTEDRAFT_223509 [Capitella teleta]
MAEGQIVLDNDHVYFISKEGDETLEEVGEAANIIEVSRPDPSFFQEGSCFDDLESFETCMKQYMQQTHTVFVTQDSRTSAAHNRKTQPRNPIDEQKFKYAYIRYICKHFGNAKPGSKSMGLRKHKNSFRIGCPAKFTLAYCQNISKYRLSKCNLVHNHPLGPEYNILYPERRQLTDREAERVKDMLREKNKPQFIIDALNLHSKITVKDIRNFRAQMKINPDTKMRIGRSGRLPMPYPDLISHHQASAVTPVEDEVPALEDNSHISVSVVMADEVAGLLIPQENDEEEEEAEAENSVVKTEPSEESAPTSTDDSILSTLVLDVNAGKPAANLQVAVWLNMPQDNSWIQLTIGTTDAQGQCHHLLSPQQVTVGSYKLILDSEAYYAEHGEESFFPHIEIEFRLKDVNQRLHIPVHLSPNGYTTSCVRLS